MIFSLHWKAAVLQPYLQQEILRRSKMWGSVSSCLDCHHFVVVWLQKIRRYSEIRVPIVDTLEVPVPIGDRENVKTHVKCWFESQMGLAAKLSHPATNVINHKTNKSSFSFFSCASHYPFSSNTVPWYILSCITVRIILPQTNIHETCRSWIERIPCPRYLCTQCQSASVNSMIRLRDLAKIHFQSPSIILLLPIQHSLGSQNKQFWQARL